MVSSYRVECSLLKHKTKFLLSQYHVFSLVCMYHSIRNTLVKGIIHDSVFSHPCRSYALLVLTNIVAYTFPIIGLEHFTFNTHAPQSQFTHKTYTISPPRHIHALPQSLPLYLTSLRLQIIAWLSFI